MFAIAAGGNHSLALYGDGRLLAWGSNAYYQLGNPASTANVRTPTPFAASLAGQLYTISAGLRHSAAQGAGGTAYTWGNNAQGQVGQPGLALITPSKQPTAAGFLLNSEVLPPVVEVVTGGYRTAFFYKSLEDPGVLRLYFAGDNALGQIGNGGVTNTLTPVPGISPTFTSVAAGRQHSLAVEPGGTVLAWGDYGAGQLGDGRDAASAPANPTRASTPVRVQIPAGTAIRYLSGIAKVAAGIDYSLALKQDGTAWAWGDNTHGQLGDATVLRKPRAVAVKNLTGIRALATPYHTSAAVDNKGDIWTWGRSPWGASTVSSTPVKIFTATAQNRPIAIAGVANLSPSPSFFVLRADGKVMCFGVNSGIIPGIIGGQVNFIEIAGLNNIVALAAGQF